MKMRWWMPTVIGVGIVAIANVCLVATWFHVRPTQVQAHPYVASEHEDAHRQAMDAFVSRGWTLVHHADAKGVTLSLTGPQVAVTEANVRLYRPDAPGLDRIVVWSDVRSDLHLDLPRPGAWDVHVAFRDPDSGLVSVDQRVERIPSK